MNKIDTNIMKTLTIVYMLSAFFSVPLVALTEEVFLKICFIIMLVSGAGLSLVIVLVLHILEEH